MVQTRKVETNTWKMPHIPWRAGSPVEAGPLAMAEDPSPASLEKLPRMNPHCTAAAAP